MRKTVKVGYTPRKKRHADSSKWPSSTKTRFAALPFPLLAVASNQRSRDASHTRMSPVIGLNLAKPEISAK